MMNPKSLKLVNTQATKNFLHRDASLLNPNTISHWPQFFYYFGEHWGHSSVGNGSDSDYWKTTEGGGFFLFCHYIFFIFSLSFPIVPATFWFVPGSKYHFCSRAPALWASLSPHCLASFNFNAKLEVPNCFFFRFMKHQFFVVSTLRLGLLIN